MIQSHTVALCGLFYTHHLSLFFSPSFPCSRTPQSPRVVTAAAKTCKSPAKPSSIPVPTNRAQLCGTKRLRSVSLEKLPNSLAAKRPSKTSTPESTNADSTTTSSDGTGTGMFGQIHMYMYACSMHCSLPNHFVGGTSCR